MRNALPFASVAAVIVLTGCTTTRADGSPQIQTSSEAERESVGAAMASPLRDLNVLRTKIPDVLLRAMADPYERPPTRVTCAQLSNLITPLNNALGADLDVAPTDEDDLLERSRGAALGAMASVTSSAIPFRGWARKLTGAERHDAFVQAAINAGAVRRAYLKGLGEAKGCNPPATPSHELAGAPIPTQGLKPRYPVRR